MIIFVVFIIVVIGIFYAYSSLKSSPSKEIVALNEEEVSAIVIDYNEDRKIIKDRNEIKKILDTFSKMELKSRRDSTSFKESQSIRIIKDYSITYLLYLYDNHSIDIFSTDKEELGKYQIINAKTINLQNLLKKISE
ncbi:hypothetical protein NDK47_01015 [Brevibacillus ruminantium]|uniref:DUF5301 domain-containing protein n=1 Tax=Brevibacillus ruminantium TaxID=2950604 RepID=A0ABY4WGY4_9BACL|nr:hypothetical protein [Brevibacillus ruminantium]USG65969.1 hypothetical protein NDK47_01015 [Brevibacillus ruminantium]